MTLAEAPQRQLSSRVLVRSLPAEVPGSKAHKVGHHPSGSVSGWLVNVPPYPKPTSLDDRDSISFVTTNVTILRALRVCHSERITRS